MADQTQQTDLGLPSDADLFKQAMAPDPIPAPEQIEQRQPDAQPGERQEQPRDERGRFASPEQTAQQQQPPPQSEQQQPPAQQQPPSEDEHDVPSWRHREMRMELQQERDARRQEADRMRQLEQAYYDQQQQLAALRQQQRPPEPPAQIPDMVTDPQGYHQHVQQQFTSQLRTMEQNFSFRLAHDRHGELFEQAYGEMIHRAERGDPSVVQAVMRSPDPGAAMVNWFHRELTLARVGGDPDKWFESQLDERLKDQKFSGALLEKMRGQTQQAQTNGGGAPPVRLPPSLHSMAASAPVRVPDGEMPSDPQLFDYAFRQNRPRR